MTRPDTGQRRSAELPGRIHGQRAFSLVELVIVVVIIAVIAAIAVPRATEASRNATAAAMAAHIRKLADAFAVYHAEHGSWPTDTAAGVLPSEMAGRLRPSDFGPSPAGGLYDWQNWLTKGGDNIGGCFIGVAWGQVDGQQSNVTDWVLLQKVDSILNDGSLSTGAFIQFTHNQIGGGGMAGLRLVIQ